MPAPQYLIRNRIGEVQQLALAYWQFVDSADDDALRHVRGIHGSFAGAIVEAVLVSGDRGVPYQQRTKVIRNDNAVADQLRLCVRGEQHQSAGELLLDADISGVINRASQMRIPDRNGRIVRERQ